MLTGHLEVRPSHERVIQFGAVIIHSWSGPRHSLTCSLIQWRRLIRALRILRHSFSVLSVNQVVFIQSAKIAATHPIDLTSSSHLFPAPILSLNILLDNEPSELWLSAIFVIVPNLL